MKHMKVVEGKLGREKAYGQAIAKGAIIEITPKQSERERIDTLIHEALHLIPQTKIFDEEAIVKASNSLSHLLWQQGYRRVLQ